MAFIFRMTFTGLCAFVQNTNGQEGRVLLVDGRNPPTGSGRNPHVPTIRYKGTRHQIARKDVEIKLTNPFPSTLTLNLADLGQAPDPDTDEERSAYWIAEMANLYAGAAADDCFVEQNVRPSVIDRVKLTAGHLTTFRMVEDPEAFGQVDVIVWDYVDEAGNSIGADHARAMAAAFSVVALVEGSGVTVRTRDFGSTGAWDEKLLEPVGGEVWIQIENLCYCEDNQGKLEDFGWFYDLAARYQDIYYPVRPGGGLTDTMCPPTRFDSHPNA